MGIKDKLFDWVDEGFNPKDRSFNLERTERLFAAFVLSSALAGLPAAVIGLFIISYHSGEKHRLKQEAGEQFMNELEKAAHEGETGEAFRRLFGVQEVPKPDEKRD